MASEMVERVAKAIEVAELRWKAENGGDDDSCVDCPGEVKARAAIEEMREPTEAMANEANDVNLDEPFWPAWYAAIDEALK